MAKVSYHLYNERGRRVRKTRFRGNFFYQLRLENAPFDIVFVGRWNEGFLAFNIYRLTCCSNPLLRKHRCKNCGNVPNYQDSKVELIKRGRMSLVTAGYWDDEANVISELEHHYGDLGTLESIVVAQDVYRVVRALLGPEPKIGMRLERRWL